MSHYIESEAYAAAPSLLNAGLNERQLFTEDPTDLTDGLRSLDGEATTRSAEQNRAVANLCCFRDLVAADTNDTTSHRPWYMEDPLNSRRRPINCGARDGYTVTNPDIRIKMATSSGRELLLMGLKRSPTAMSYLN